VINQMPIMFLLMLLPIAALPVFWLLPLRWAVPVYLFSILLSGLMFWVMRKTMKRPVEVGVESLIGKDAEVVSGAGADYGAPYLVRAEHSLWSARSHDDLQPGEVVKIVAVEGNTLIVERKNTGTD
jgi:membrane protein implicated in regulation of membrane protease activity